MDRPRRARTGLLVLRVWAEDGAASPPTIVVRMTTVDDVEHPQEVVRSVGSVDEAVDAVRGWLLGWMA
jgi:hypothetical protein